MGYRERRKTYEELVSSISDLRSKVEFIRNDLEYSASVMDDAFSYRLVEIEERFNEWDEILNTFNSLELDILNTEF